MTKILFSLLAVIYTVQLHAGVQYNIADTSSIDYSSNSMELVQLAEPVYLDGVVIPATHNGNWFVTLSGGANAFLGTPLGCEDLFGRIRPTFSVAVGKWFTPAVGARIDYNGVQFKDAVLSNQRFHYIHADIMWNVFGRRYARQDMVRWTLAPYAGVGLIHHASNGHNPFAVSYGIQGQYKISRRISFLLELGGTTTFQDFDGVGKPNRPGDNMLSLTAGISFSVGRTGWKRAVDATPCLYQNEQLVRMTNKLIEYNRYYANAHERDRKALAELKKILEIEGILEDYSHLFVADSTKANDYPKNNYSGLNSLMARLKNKKWNGQFVSEMQDSEPTVPSGIPVDSLNIPKNNSSFNGRDTLGYRSSVKGDTITDNYLSMLKTGKLYVGAPVYFFFELGSTNLTDKSQLINLDELARIALKYKLCVSVVGAADSATGSDSINNSLGIKRAEYIADELKSRGIADECILKDNKGGIAQFSPEKANRHTKVLLMLKE